MRSVTIGTYELFENGELYKRNNNHNRISDGYMMSPYKKRGDNAKAYYRLKIDGIEKNMYVDSLLEEYFGITSNKGKEWIEQIKDKAKIHNGTESRLGRKSKHQGNQDLLSEPFEKEFKGLPDDIYDPNLICPFN